MDTGGDSRRAVGWFSSSNGILSVFFPTNPLSLGIRFHSSKRAQNRLREG